jgi:hypothetical protein
MRQGKQFEFAHGVLTLHPLTLGQLQDHEEDLKALGAKDANTNQRLARVLAAAAVKAQPDITDRKILDMIDMQDIRSDKIGAAIKWVMGESGLRETAEGSATADPRSPPGETATASPSPGGSGTPVSA